MKIGILTFHDGINHGAYLQCYALFRTLQNFDNEVVIINYKNFTHWLKEARIFYIPKKPFVLPSNLSKISKFKKAHRKFNLTEFTFSKKKVSKISFDVVVVGSDIVWNFENQYFGFDTIYFGDSLTAKKLISYAPSFGNINLETSPPENIITGLKKFNAISVRDENSKKIIAKCLSKDVPVVLDPTFLFDFSGNETNCSENDFILVYAFYIPDELISKIKLFAKKNKKKLIAVGYHNSWCDKNVVALDPFEWLGYIKSADYIFTSTFHGTIFSLKYNKSFLTYPHSNTKLKVESLLKKLDLGKRLINENSEIDKLFEKPIEYDKVNNIIKLDIENSIEYLKKSIFKEDT